MNDFSSTVPRTRHSDDGDPLPTPEDVVPGMSAGVLRVVRYWKPGDIIQSSRQPTDPPGVDPHYRLIEVVNWGRTSLVYKAIRERKLCAMKFMWFASDLQGAPVREIAMTSLPDRGFHGDIARPGTDREHILRIEKEQIELEAAILQTVAEVPHVIKLLEIVYVRRHVVFVFDYMPGACRRFTSEGDGVSAAIAASWCEQLIETLTKLHDFDDLSAVVHGDLKTDNLLISNDAKVTVIDFGAAARVTKLEAYDHKTEDVFFGGSASHCPPESLTYVKTRYFPELAKREDTIQFTKRTSLAGTIAPRPEENVCRQCSTDVWCLGLVLLELMVGDTPFGALCTDNSVPGMARILDMVTTEKYLQLLWNLLKEKISATALDFLQKCMKISPAERPSAAALREHPFLREKKASGQLRDAYGILDGKLYRVSNVTGALSHRERSSKDVTPEVFKIAASQFWENVQTPPPPLSPDPQPRWSLMQLAANVKLPVGVSNLFRKASIQEKVETPEHSIKSETPRAQTPRPRARSPMELKPASPYMTRNTLPSRLSVQSAEKEVELSSEDDVDSEQPQPRPWLIRNRPEELRQPPAALTVVNRVLQSVRRTQSNTPVEPWWNKVRTAFRGSASMAVEPSGGDHTEAEDHTAEDGTAPEDGTATAPEDGTAPEDATPAAAEDATAPTAVATLAVDPKMLAVDSTVSDESEPPNLESELRDPEKFTTANETALPDE